ncbi:hypothetical protein B1218_38545, partial [Pseudomonas ogarae]
GRESSDDGLAGATEVGGRDGDAIVRPFEGGRALWKAGVYVRFGGDELKFGRTFKGRPQDLDRRYEAVGGVVNKVE